MNFGLALQPLFAALHAQLLTAPVLRADETPVAQLDPRGGQDQTRLPIRVPEYRLPPYCPVRLRADPAGKHVAAFLGDWKGDLMVDDYSGYKALFAKGVTELGCWAHARRKFFDAHAASGSPVAKEAIERIGELYAIDAAPRDLDPGKRDSESQRLLVPKLAVFRCWLAELQPKVLGSTSLASKTGRRKLSDPEIRLTPTWAVS